MRESQPVLGWAPRETELYENIPPEQFCHLTTNFATSILHTEVRRFASEMAPSTRRKYKRASDPDYIPRPPNAFILFRNEYARNHAQVQNANPGSRLPDPNAKSLNLSRRAGDAWKILPEEQKKLYQKLARFEKREHERRHPNYKYQPNGTIQKRIRNRTAMTISSSDMLPSTGPKDLRSMTTSIPTIECLPLPQACLPSPVAVQHQRLSFPHPRDVPNQEAAGTTQWMPASIGQYSQMLQQLRSNPSERLVLSPLANTGSSGRGSGQDIDPTGSTPDATTSGLCLWPGWFDVGMAIGDASVDQYESLVQTHFQDVPSPSTFQKGQPSGVTATPYYNSPKQWESTEFASMAILESCYTPDVSSSSGGGSARRQVAYHASASMTPYESAPQEYWLDNTTGWAQQGLFASTEQTVTVDDSDTRTTGRAVPGNLACYDYDIKSSSAGIVNYGIASDVILPSFYGAGGYEHESARATYFKAFINELESSHVRHI